VVKVRWKRHGERRLLGFAEVEKLSCCPYTINEALCGHRSQYLRSHLDRPGDHQAIPFHARPSSPITAGVLGVPGLLYRGNEPAGLVAKHLNSTSGHGFPVHQP